VVKENANKPDLGENALPHWELAAKHDLIDFELGVIDVEAHLRGDVREVVLKRNRYGHYVANGSINGSQVEFLLDTGATAVAVPAATAA